MANLKLASPKLMDVAVPANLACGKGPTDEFSGKRKKPGTRPGFLLTAQNELTGLLFSSLFPCLLFGDNRFRDIVRAWRVVRELHRELPAT